MQVWIIGRDEDDTAEVAEALAELGVDWQIERLTDVTVVLRRLQGAAPDVVVCDLRPLGMEGGALLERVKAHAPKAARIMLLEERDAGQAMRVLGCAHRLLNKPLRAEELLEAVESIADLQELLSSEELRTAIGRVDRLPPPPKLYLALGNAVNDPDTSLVQVAALVQQDPVTAAKVLRVCNSAFFSGGRTVSDVRAAVIRLGQQELRRIVLASEVFADAESGEDREASRLRSLMASRLAGRIIDSASAEMAATAALLAEVGLLLPGVRKPGADGELVGEGPHYAEAGAFLLGMWGLPMPIVEAVAYHCQPQRAHSRGFWMVGAVHVACALAARREVDLAYLEAVGVADRLPQWLRWAAELAGPAEPAPPPLAEDADEAALEPTPAPKAAPSAQLRRKAALDVLAGQASVRIDEGDVSYYLLGSVQGSERSVAAVDAILSSQPFDAIALEMCDEQLASLHTPATPRRPGLWSLLVRADSGRALGRYLLDGYRRLRIERWASDPCAPMQELVAGARQRACPVWPVDLPLDDLLDYTLAALHPISRLHYGLAARERLRRGVPDDARDLGTAGDALQASLDVLVPGHKIGLQTLYPERAQHLVTALRQRAAASGAQRVLVLLAASHVPGVKRAFRELTGPA